MKIKTYHLAITLLILLVIVIITKIIMEKRAMGNMRTEFFEFDSGAIVSFVIYPKMNRDLKYSIDYKNEHWCINNPALKDAAIDPEVLNRAVTELQKLRPSSFITDSKKEWGQYGVDSTGTLLEIILDNGAKYAIILGNLAFQNNQFINTYVRLPEEKAVYAVEAYYEGTFKGLVNDWRMKSVLETAEENWKNIDIITAGYPLLSISVIQNSWSFEGHKLDTTLQKSVSSLITKLKSSSLIDFSINKIEKPEISLIIRDANDYETRINLIDNNYYWIMESSINQGNYFMVDKSDVNDFLKIIEEIRSR